MPIPDNNQRPTVKVELTAENVRNTYKLDQ
jgi:hypothetical protein